MLNNMIMIFFNILKNNKKPNLFYLVIVKEDCRENTYLFLWEVSLLHVKLFQTCRDMNNSFKQDFLAPYKIYLSLISPTFLSL